MQNNYEKKMESKKIVSFDIFDTLIKRNLSQPQDVFEIVEIQYNKRFQANISNFRSNRIVAERKCRDNSSSEEITIDEIYTNLEKYYTSKELVKLKEIEKQVEVDICYLNPDIIELYNWCQRNKTVIITSDMYLDEETITNILEKNGIKYNKLYLSSKVKKTKASGSIYKFILNDMQINPEEMIHIGDNKKSDYFSAKKNGVEAIVWRNIQQKDNNDHINLNLLNNYFKRYQFDNYLEAFGFKCLGPLLFSFNLWLIQQLEKNSINKVFFLARDGFVMKQVFDIINTNSNIESYYLYASRRSIIVPSLYKCKSIDEIFKKMYVKEKVSISSLFKKIGIDDLDIAKKISEKYDIDINQEYNFHELLQNKEIRAMFDELLPVIIENSKKEYEAFIKYKEKMNFSGKVAIVDIGWFGNMQHALESLELDIDLYGYYMGIEPRKNYQREHKMYGFLFETDNNYELFLKEHNFNSIFEMLFLAQHGSVKRFNSEKDEMVEFYDYEYNHAKEKNDIITMQEYAFKFARDYYQSNLWKYMNDDLYISFNKMCDVLLNPSLDIAKLFGNFCFFDDETKAIAKPDKIIKYVNIKKFVEEYKRSTWRIGFLKRTFKISLPYYQINMFIRKYYLNRKEKLWKTR